MKHFLFIVLIVFQSKVIKSQIVFCPPGAEWHYLFGGAFSPNNTFNEMILHNADSISGIDTIKQLMHYRFFLQCSPTVRKTLVKQKGDTVFFLNSRTQNTWQILYNFAAQPGQSWQTTVVQSNNVPITFTYTVDSVKTVFMNGFNLRQLKLKAPSGYQGLTVIERIGAMFLFPYDNSGLGFCDGNEFIEPLCYNDASFGTKQFSEKSCNYFTINYVGVLNQQNEVAPIEIYPNPAQSLLSIKSIELLSDNCKIYVTNATGADMKINPPLNTSSTISQIDINELSTGLYFLQLYKSDKLLFTEKFVKE